MENKKVIGIAQVLQHLKDGMTRDDIAAEYGITTSECKLLFQDSRLKGKKTIKKPSFVIVDDITNETETKVENKEEITDKISPDVAVGPGNDVVADTNDVDTTKDDVQPEDNDVVAEEEVKEAPRATWGD